MEKIAKTKMASNGHFVKIGWKKAYALHNLIKNAPINFTFDVAYYRGRSLSILAKIVIQNGRWRPFWKNNLKKRVSSYVLI